jgi:hypothetical protein
MTTSNGLCTCGCGAKTTLNGRGEPNRFVHGHNRRGTGIGWKQNGYWYVSVDGRKVAFHRFVMETLLGRRLTGDEVIHHLDGDPSNNDPDNLVILTRAEHARLHRRGVRGRNANKQERERIVFLKRSGMTAQEVSEATGRPYSTVQRWISEAA